MGLSGRFRQVNEIAEVVSARGGEVSLDTRLDDADLLTLKGNIFSGKKILVSGDSITDSAGTASKKWHSYLADWIGFDVINDGKSATGLIRTNGSVPGIYTRIDTWDSTYGDFDAIVIMGNMNDGGLGQTAFPVGAFADSDPTASQYGALHGTIQKLLLKYPDKPILWIVSTPRLASATYPAPNDGAAWGINGWFEPYCNAVLDVCNHYSIPVLDLYHASGLRPWNAVNNGLYFYSTDGVHPNNLGHEIIAAKISDFFVQNVDLVTNITVPTAMTFELGTINPGPPLFYTAVTARARNTAFFPCLAGDRFFVKDTSKHNIAVYECSAAADNTYLLNAPSWVSAQTLVNAQTRYARIALKKMDGTDFTTAELLDMNNFFVYVPA